MYDNLIIQTALKNGMPLNLAKLLVAQAKYETANYTSNTFKQNNNLFGYKYVGQKLATKGTAAPKSEGDFYAKYKTIEDSVRELTAYIKRRVAEGVFPTDLTTVTSPAQYAALLGKKGYFGVSVTQYAKGLARYLKTVTFSPVLVIGLIATLFYFLYQK